jgi:hypothetical protein
MPPTHIPHTLSSDIARTGDTDDSDTGLPMPCPPAGLILWLLDIVYRMFQAQHVSCVSSAYVTPCGTLARLEVPVDAAMVRSVGCAVVDVVAAGGGQGWSGLVSPVHARSNFIT